MAAMKIRKEGRKEGRRQHTHGEGGEGREGTGKKLWAAEWTRARVQAVGWCAAVGLAFALWAVFLAAGSVPASTSLVPRLWSVFFFYSFSFSFLA